MHLTIGVPNPTTMALMRWLTEKLTEHEAMRIDVPRFVPTDHSEEYLRAVRSLLVDALSDPTLLTRFFDDLDAFAMPRQAFGLPWSATKQCLPPNSDEYVIRLSTARGFVISDSTDENLVNIVADGQCYQYPRAATLLFDYLNQNAPLPVKQFRGEFLEVLDAGQIDVFLADLVQRGLITLCWPCTPPHSATRLAEFGADALTTSH